MIKGPKRYARIRPYDQWEVRSQMFGNGTVIFSIVQIKRSYPDQWVAIAVRETDADGLPSAGEVLMHDADERFVWSALKLGEADDLVHVFYTGGPRTITAAA